MTPRRPIPAAVSRATLPTLAALVAGSSLACQSPHCADSRSGELLTHGQNGTRDLTHGELSGGMRELGVALGLVSHPMTVGGAPPPVTALPTPTVVAPPPPVTPVETPVAESQIRPPGGMMRVQAHDLAMEHPQPTPHRRAR